MSKSLNQAFIKAYSKEQASLVKQQTPEKNSSAQGENFRIEDFIVRFDTATCIIPTHHATAGQKPKIAAATITSLPLPTVAPTPPRTTAAAAAAAVPGPNSEPGPGPTAAARQTPVSAPSPKQLPTPTSTSGATVLNLSRRGRSHSTPARPGGSHREQELAAERQAAEELRQTIASQMSRAGNWEAQQIDAFDAGFPMVSQFHQRRGNSAPANREKANLSSHLQGPHFGGVEARAAEKLLLAGKQHATRGSQREEEELGSRRELGLDGAPVSRSETRQNEMRQEEAPVSRSEMRQNEMRQDEAPVSRSETRQNEAVRDQQATLAAQLNRDARVQDCNGGGEIFRLDRPTYQQRPEDADRNEYTDSGDLSSEVLGLSASGTNVDLEALDARIEGLRRESSTVHHRVDTPERGRESLQEAASQRAPRVDSMAASNNNHHDNNAHQPNSHNNNARATTSAAAANASATPTATTTSSGRRRDWPAKSQEQDLRKAKVRIFNPVWEVDNFQWPDICIELLQQRAEAMEAVARNLIEACQEGLQVLAVTSPHSGEGRTTVACCLAKLAGSRGLNVAIVDGDIENPTLSVQTNLELEQDWKTAIFNQLPLEEVAVHSIDDQVTLVPLMQPINHDEMAIDDNRIEFMLQELSASFDLVIVDMGHMGSSRSLVTSLGERGVISAVVAVVDYRSSTRQQVDQCLQRIRKTGVASIGLVENFAA